MDLKELAELMFPDVHETPDELERMYSIEDI